MINIFNKIKEYFFPTIKGEKLNNLVCGFRTTYPDVTSNQMTKEEYNKHWAEIFELARKAES